MKFTTRERHPQLAAVRPLATRDPLRGLYGTLLGSEGALPLLPRNTDCSLSTLCLVKDWSKVFLAAVALFGHLFLTASLLITRLELCPLFVHNLDVVPLPITTVPGMHA